MSGVTVRRVHDSIKRIFGDTAVGLKFFSLCDTAQTCRLPANAVRTLHNYLTRQVIASLLMTVAVFVVKAAKSRNG